MLKKYYRLYNITAAINVFSTSVNNSDVVISSTSYVRNGLRNTVLGVMFAYLGCEGGGSFDFELCSPINSMNAL